MADVQRTVQRIDEEILRHRRDTNDAINRQMQLVLTDKEKVIDPHTGLKEIVPTNEGQVFFGKNGDLLLCEDPNWDPNKDPRYWNGGCGEAETPAVGPPRLRSVEERDVDVEPEVGERRRHHFGGAVMASRSMRSRAVHVYGSCCFLMRAATVSVSTTRPAESFTLSFSWPGVTWTRISVSGVPSSNW